jgi:hypothetical protein
MSESPLSLFIVQINIGFIILFLLFDKNNSEHPFGITTLDLKGYNNVVKIKIFAYKDTIWFINQNRYKFIFSNRFFYL